MYFRCFLGVVIYMSFHLQRSARGPACSGRGACACAPAFKREGGGGCCGVVVIGFFHSERLKMSI